MPETDCMGKRGKVLYEAFHHQVNTWIPTEDYKLLTELAKVHKVKLSVYLRAIIVDALQDERLSGINITVNQ